MKASELIIELQNAIKKYGDLRVKSENWDVEEVGVDYATPESIEEHFEGGTAKTEPFFDL